MIKKTIMLLLLAPMLLVSGVHAQIVLSGYGNVVGENIRHPSGNIFDQVLLTGQSIKLQAKPGQITRVSFMDEDGDIVQVEFSGAGNFTVTLDPATYLPSAFPAKYNQDVMYVTGKPTVVIEGADATTFLSIFTVGRINAVDQALFPEGEVYDGEADVKLVEVINSTGMGGMQLSNTVFSGNTGKVGVDARGVPIAVRLTIGDIDASGDAVPYLLFGEGSFTTPASNPGLRITGGDLAQTNGAAIVVAESESTTPGFDTLISQNNFKSDYTPQPTLSIDATFTNEEGDEITVAVEELTIDMAPPRDPGMLAPENEAAFNDLVVGQRILSALPTYYVDFATAGRFEESEGAATYTGSYAYSNTGPDTGTVVFNYDDGDQCTSSLTFVSETEGTLTYTCNDGSSGGYNWLLVAISATGTPDLVVQTPSVSDSSPNAGGGFTLSATVRNQGNGLSASTTLRYYRSPDATISTSDTAVGTDAVGGLAASGTSAESISLTAPSTAGTYYYGACVDPVSGESATGNNCSDSRAVTVRSGSTAVIIPDANLRAVVEAALGKASGAPITAADMETLTYLIAGQAGISDLTGLESAANLSWLDLGRNGITDISPLSGLTNLTELWMYGNRITDVSPLSGLITVTTLILSG